MASGIYIIQNTVNGKCYVGSAVNLSQRRNGHLGHLRRGTHRNPHLQASFIKHGEAAFEFKAIEECPKDALLEREQHWLDTSKPEYNICKTAGSRLGAKLSPETRAKISAAAMGHKRRLGAKHSAETRAKMSASRVGKKKSPEQRAKLSAAGFERKHSPETLAKMSASSKGHKRGLGRKCSPETRAKMAASQKRRQVEVNKCD